MVKAGQVLYEIDPTLYQSAVNEATASLRNAQAVVAAAEAKSRRYGELVDIEGVSRQEVDDAKAAHEQARAAVEQQRAVLETARVNLAYTQVRAPIGGRIGKSTVTPGALVTASQADPLATIRKLDPMYVDVTQSSADLLRLRQVLSTGGLRPADAAIKMVLEDESAYAQPGRLKFSEVAVDESTGTVTLRAEFPNPDGVLLPGMYVRAVLTEAVEPEAIMAPQQGITRDPKGGATALVLNAENKVVPRAVTTRRSIGDQWLVASGLSEGDRLIVQGLNKVKAGDTVNPVTVDPKAPAAPARPATAGGR
ncbi:membrane-fusion protein [Acidovorax sp. MR-S7]|nr:membrane-fusion protein [Acidovorax sp. MR-S7]